MVRTVSILAALAAIVLGGFAVPANATSIIGTSGFSPSGHPVSYGAEFSVSADILTLKLSNTTTPGTLSPDGLLCSFFFDVVDGGGTRPALSLLGATGDVWQPNQNAPDTLHEAGANLMAVNKDDDTWAFRTFDASLSPFLGFGVGTVGNSDLSPNNFNGSIVGDFGYSLYAGDVITANLKKRLLVKDMITFTFSGVSGFAESDISSSVVFGLGTGPDLLLPGGSVAAPAPVPVPEPITVASICMGLACLGGYVRRRRMS